MRKPASVLLSLALAACRAGGWDPDPAELARLEATVLAEAEANRTRQCPRPVLHGDPQAGNADVDILALVTRPESFGACHDAMQEPPIQAWLEDPLHLPDEAARIADVCEPVAAAIARAVAHEDACSPFLIGRNRPDSSWWVQMFRVTKAGALIARDRWRRGDHGGAIDLLADLIRLGHDVSRGPGADGMLAMIGNVVAGNATRLGLRPLLSDPAATAEDLAQVVRELDRLIATAPGFGDSLDGDAQSFTLHLTLPLLKGPDWVPPGGLNDLDRDALKVLGQGKDGPAQVVAGWVAMAAAEQRVAAACRQGPGIPGCADAVRRLADEARRGQPARVSVSASFPTDADTGRKLSRDEFLAWSVTEAARWSLRRLRFTVHTALELAAVRLHARARLARLQGRPCPTTDDFRSVEWRPEPVHGIPVEVTKGTEGNWILRPAEDGEWNPGEGLLYCFACP